MNLQMLKRALIAYVTSSAKAIWSAIAHPLSIVGSKKCNVKDYKIYAGGKNLLDVKKYYGDYANNNGGISVPNSAILYYLTYDCEKVAGVFKENTQYTFSCKYNIAETTTTVLTPRIRYTDGTISNFYIGYGYRIGEGVATLTSNEGKTVESFGFTYGTTSKVFKGELTEMQLEEGTSATEYEPYQYTDNFPVTVRGKNLLDVNKVYPDYVNNEGGITFTRRALANLYNTNMYDNYRENTQYTFSCDYETTVDNNAVYPYVFYTDGTKQAFYNTLYSETTGSFSGHCAVTTTAGKTVSRFIFAYSTSARTCDVELTDMQLEEGATATGCEPYIEPQTIDIFLDEPIGAGEVIQQSVDGLPNLPQYKGTTIYEVQADTPPSGIEVCYYG